MEKIVFRGGPVLRLDGKGRLTVPTRWREQLMELAQGHLVVTKNSEGCLDLYPLPVWEKLEPTLMELSRSEGPWRRLMLGSATDVEIDAGARVLIPPELRSWALIEKETDVSFMGVGNHFELWNPARLAASEAKAIEKGEPDVLSKLVVR